MLMTTFSSGRPCVFDDSVKLNFPGQSKPGFQLEARGSVQGHQYLPPPTSVDIFAFKLKGRSIGLSVPVGTATW
jgi:hypothetical protein